MSINILHIDDEEEIAIHLDEICQNKSEDILIQWCETFDEGIKALKEKPFLYNGLILDAKCLISEDDGILDEKNVIKAIFELESIFRSFQSWLPYCILSGFKDKLEREINLFNITAFDKNSEESDAIDFIVHEQVKVNRHNVDKLYPGIIDMANQGLLEAHNISTILQLYSAIKLQTDNSGIIKAQISQLRPILERMVINLDKIGTYNGHRLIPENAVQNFSGTNKTKYLTECFKYLTGVEINSMSKNGEKIRRSSVMPSYISWQCTSIYQVASEIANHANDNTGSRYTLEGLFNSLIDVLYWYKNFMQNR